MSMGIKQKLIKGIEYDVIYAKRLYCYLKNNNKLVRYVKKQMRKRRRVEGKNEVNKNDKCNRTD
jgi:hypothetical protein